MDKNMNEWDRVTRRITPRFLFTAALLLAAYASTARIGLAVAPVHQIATLVWPASGIALGAVLIGGYMYAPVVIIGAFIAYLSAGVGPFLALSLAVGCALDSYLGAYVLKRFIGFNYLLRRMRDALWLVITALVVPILSASVAVLCAWAAGIAPGDLSRIWVAWWVGHALGILVITPFLVRWIPRPRFLRTRAQLVEAGSSLCILLVLSVLVFWTPYTALGGIPLFYALLIPLVWVSLRVGPRAMALALLLNGIIAVSGVLFGYSATVAPPTATSLLPFLLVIGVMSGLFLLFTSLEEERKEVTQALRDYVGYLEQALQKISSEDEAKNEFLAILAHELRNPLAPILSSLELMKLQGVDSPETPALVEIMDDRVRTMGRLLDDLLDISRITRKKFTLQKETADLRGIIKHAVDEVMPLIRSYHHTLSVQLPEFPLLVQADPVRLEQVFANLLTNSAKYTDPEGAIRLSARREGLQMVVSVRDTGIGIPPEMLERIFEPFLQVDRAKRPSAGLGIGLSLTKYLVEMHGGVIEARSQGPGSGSEFVVRLPAAEAIIDEEETAPMETQQNTPRSPLFRILVVDDNEAAAQALGRLLEFKGHTVALAYNGRGALRAATEFEPNVIILDIGLPDIDGYEVAERLRTEMGYGAILIALTGYGQSEDKLRADVAGFDYHLTKPIGLADVEKALLEVFHRSKDV